MDKKYDIIIIGSGIAGMTAAVTAAEAGLHVAVLSKENVLEECNTFYAQGGIVYTSTEDSPQQLYSDIMAAGDNINNKKAVKYLCEHGPQSVREFLIEKIKVPFSRGEDGEISRTKEAAHSRRRIIYIKDKSGEAIITHLLAYARQVKNIDFFPSHIAIDLITNTHNSSDYQARYQKTRVIGVYIYNNINNRVEKYFAPSVILATGGVGNLFLHTSNPKGATGDGIAMAYRIGAEIINAEYIQFHPTVLFHRDLNRFLITEAMRGEGARLINRQNQYFMSHYDPRLLDLAPRDEVVRAIFREMEKEGSPYVRLDTSCIKNVKLKERFPGIYQTCLGVGLDIEKEPIPVVPAAHYFCGGVKVNLSGETSIIGLYAVGETACTGVHGANRLASVSLLEGLEFGLKTARDIAAKRYRFDDKFLKTVPDWIVPDKREEFESVLIGNDMFHIQSIMWNYAGIIRSKKRLLRALSDLNYLSHRIERFYKQAKLTKEIIELRNSVLAATIIVRSAYSNTSAKGCHFIESDEE